MDASASPQIDADRNEVYGLFLKIENSNFCSIKPRSTVIKYTKLPDFEYDRKETWPSNKYSLAPRVRRIISIEGPNFVTSRSLCADILASTNTMTSNITQRKIVTITEDEENDLHPKFSRRPTPKMSSRSVATDTKREKYFSKTTASRLATPKYSKELQSSPRMRNVNSNVLKPVSRSKYSNVSQPSMSVIKQAKGKDAICHMRSANVSNISINTNVTTKSEKEYDSYKRRELHNFKSNSTITKPVEASRSQRASLQQNVKGKLLKKIGSHNNKPVTIIHVPLEDKYQKYDEIQSTVSETVLETEVPKIIKKNCSTEIEKNFDCRNIDVGTDSIPTEDREIQIVADELISPYSRIEENKTSFDSLKIPNVTLTKDRREHREEIVKFHSKSLPNLQVPALQITPSKVDDSKEPSIFKSYIISSATVTCTTRQKINFEVVSADNDTSSEQSANKLAYPMNVVSIYKKKMMNTESNSLSSKNTYKNRDKSKAKYTNQLNELNLDCSYVFNNSKLVKPSDIISTIRFNSLLQTDYISEQFQRELNFIDSFFESLQYLESCSFPEKEFSDNKIQTWVHKAGFDVINPDYGSFLSKLENGTNVDDTETMASKSLCLLNLLIRDEQRRAKNLLFVLKMREDALKDFTKSQILWLEDKKKQDNTDISTLKKKQRGALLKLQHECGEMQRMRKALLTLTEKRKVALLKTKKNIELKLSNSLNVDQLLIGKKKLKKGPFDRSTAPLKCFDLSSSGCDDSGTSRGKPEMPLAGSTVVHPQITSVEKSIQTGDSILETTISTDTAAENFVVVDGGYLNILFHNLSLPQIFSRGKRYEVNEEALKNIVHSSNIQHIKLNQTDVIEKLMDHVKNSEVECSTPSTARSLVEEMDQYYKDLKEGEKSMSDRESGEALEVKDSVVQVFDYIASPSQCDSNGASGASINISKETVMNANDVGVSEDTCGLISAVEVEAAPQTGPLPVPAGAVATVEPQPAPDVPIWLLPTSSTSTMSTEGSCSSQPLSKSMVMSGLSSPVHEAEELRRQQLAIEREIKALEQQQCQLVVREIPDKPPPPYTPPTESRLTRIPRMYLADETTSQRVHKYITNPNLGPCDPTDAFDVFVNDFCNDTIRKNQMEESDKPWDACNLLPQKQQVDTEKLLAKTSEELVDVFTGVAPTVVSGVASRRSDHIEDILFSEWRRCEPEWTALHTDEASVKNQLFESIFQRILTETIDEYKRIVQVQQFSKKHLR